MTIARLFNEAMQILWPSGVQFDNVLLFLTDAAAYMKKAAVGLAVSYPKMIHVTCVVHGLHRICEEIRALYPTVDKLISNGKKVFIKSPKRIEIFKNKNPNTPLPPTPVVTRWGTWLAAVQYYAENMDGFAAVVKELDKDDASSIQILQDILSDSVLKNDLAYISANMCFLCNSINKLESVGLLLTEAVSVVEDVKKKLYALHGHAAQKIQKKLNDVFEKNYGFYIMCKLSNVLDGQYEENVDVSVSDIPCYKYTRLTSCHSQS